MQKFNVIGLMSGTSLDGLDIANCEFTLYNNTWTYQLLHAETISYEKELKEKLTNCIHFNFNELAVFDLELGTYFGKKTKAFIEKYNIHPTIVSSHGHTVFHQPKNGITLQIGNGLALKKEVETTVINNFRALDVQLGGQGAPLVPIGDKLLFSPYNYCLNLGGIANISFEKDGNRRAFDICSCNLVLNYFAQKLGFEYDKGGAIARSGVVNPELFDLLSKNPYYSKKGAKSLGKEDVWNYDIAMLENFEGKIEDALCTFVELIATQISTQIKQGSLLITGGGAYNTFLIERLNKINPSIEIVIPQNEIIEFKEAIIFAFLGVLRFIGAKNVLSSVTGAERDSCSGDVF